MAVIRCLNAQVAALERQLASRFTAYLNAAIVRNLPGLGWCWERGCWASSATTRTLRDTPASARVLDDAAPTLIAVAEDADSSHLEGRAEVVRLPRVDAGLDLGLLLKALSERGVRAILLEGGPTLAGSFLAAGLIDRVVAYIAPVLIGGGGKPALAGPGALNIADAKRFRLEDVARIGPDVRLTATPLS